jgi:hypothetical protein
MIPSAEIHLSRAQVAAAATSTIVIGDDRFTLVRDTQSITPNVAPAALLRVTYSRNVRYSPSIVQSHRSGFGQLLTQDGTDAAFVVGHDVIVGPNSNRILRLFNNLTLTEIRNGTLEPRRPQ